MEKVIAKIYGTNKNKIEGYLIEYKGGRKRFCTEETLKELLKIDIYCFENVKLNNDRLSFKRGIQKYQIKELNCFFSLLNELNMKKSFFKDLGAFTLYKEPYFMDTWYSDEKGLYITLKFRSQELFSEYNYDESGYDEALYLGETLLANKFRKEFSDIYKNGFRISSYGGDKLWVYAEIFCKNNRRLQPVLIKGGSW